MNKFFITYGGHSNDGRYHFSQKAVVSTLEEAVSVINAWHSYGNPKRECLIVNQYCLDKIKSFFEDGLGEFVTGEKRTYESIKTTGCGAWAIYFYYAMGDTVDEHEAAYKDKCESEQQERIRKSEEEKKKRMIELCEEKRGWYSVYLTFDCYQWSERAGGMVSRMKDFSGKCIASSKLDAYNKARNDIKMNNPELIGLNFHDPTNQNYFDAVFLGMKTDDGYSIEAWEEAKAKGEI